MSDQGGKFMVSSPGSSARGQDRNSLLVKATIRFPGSSEQGEVRVRNVSAGGLMAEAPIRAGRGETVEVQLKNIGWVNGKVAWVAETRFGIAFDVPIDPKLTHHSAPAKSADDALPNYLRKLNDQSKPVEQSKLRRL